MAAYAVNPYGVSHSISKLRAEERGQPPFLPAHFEIPALSAVDLEPEDQCLEMKTFSAHRKMSSYPDDDMTIVPSNVSSSRKTSIPDFAVQGPGQEGGAIVSATEVVTKQPQPAGPMERGVGGNEDGQHQQAPPEACCVWRCCSTVVRACCSPYGRE